MKALQISCLLVLWLFTTSVAAEPEARKQAAELDSILKKSLQEDGLQLGPIADDWTFVRRSYLRLAGRIPTVAEATAFAESAESDKRHQLIDDLLDSDEFVRPFYTHWANLLRLLTRLSNNGRSEPAGLAYEQWLKQRIRHDTPYDDFVRELVTASGDSWSDPAIGYYLRDSGMPLDNMALTTELFLGTSLVCAQCHDHPFEEWTQMDFYQMAAFTYGQTAGNRGREIFEELLPTKKRSKGRKEVAIPGVDLNRRDLRRVLNDATQPLQANSLRSTGRILRLPHDYQYDDAQPKAPVDAFPMTSPDIGSEGHQGSPEQFGAWLTSPDNPRFTQVAANRLWDYAFGAGLVEPVGAFKPIQQAQHPAVLAKLMELFQGNNFQQRKTLRALFHMELFRREAVAVDSLEKVAHQFEGPLLERLSAEEIWDSLLTLVIPETDFSHERDLAIRTRLADMQLRELAMENLDQAEVVALVRELAAKRAAEEKNVVRLKAQAAEARANKDKDRYRKLSRQVRDIQRDYEALVRQATFFDQLTEIDSDQWASRSGLGNVALTTLASLHNEGGEPMMGQQRGSALKHLQATLFPDDDEALQQRSSEAIASLQALAEEIVGDQRKGHAEREVSRFHRMTRDLRRASDMDTPARPGHFLREFGQSDRELISNESDEPSITQVLALLNSEVAGGLTHPLSALSRQLHGKTFEEQLEVSFLAFLGRPPRQAEREILLAGHDQEEVDFDRASLVRVLLNSREFLFVQ